MHVHISALTAVLYLLMGIVTFGTLRLMALAHPNSQFSQAWLLLF